MKKLLVGGWLGLILGAGCSAPGGGPKSVTPIRYPHSTLGTLAETPEEHYRRAANVRERDQKAIVEDLDLLFLTERPTRLTRWHSR